ncbi:MAG: hypothetical protein NTU59_07785, partial [Coprothermobacterota bacterium]|nr:hypothetical protein [Coprothermobacterota bacterium]
MPKISEEILLDCTKETAFSEIVTVDFMKSIDPNFGLNTEIIFQNERLLRSLSKVERIGDVEIEKIIIPESFTIVTQRRPPLAPFIYQLSIQILSEHKDGSLLKWLNEFELDEDNKPKEE